MPQPIWMLDTNILSSLIKNPRGPLVQTMRQLDPNSLCTSIIVACELRFGAQKRSSSALLSRVDELLGTLSVMALDGEVDRHYADIRCALEALGTPIGHHDLFIAAHARSSGLILVTNNTHEFNRVPGLVVEDWLSERS